MKSWPCFSGQVDALDNTFKEAHLGQVSEAYSLQALTKTLFPSYTEALFLDQTVWVREMWQE